MLQEAHPHALLLSGMTNFDKLLPGMLDEMGAANLLLRQPVSTWHPITHSNCTLFYLL